MILSETDKREVCPLHGWVGRRVFQLDRHDLCEAPSTEEPPPDDDRELDEDDEDEDDGDRELDADDEDKDEEPPRWSRSAARQRGIPPKKTVAVRRITQLELHVGRAELHILGADAPYERPKKRHDCLWCPVCQLVRDGKSDGLDGAAQRALGREEDPAEARRRRKKKDVSTAGHLACGHQGTEVIHHSRPCVFIACKHALYLDISETGSIIFNFPHLEPGQMSVKQSCSLDFADRGGMTLEEIAVVTNLTRERIRQVEVKALLRRARPAALSLGLGADDAAAAGMRHLVGPGGDLAETGVDGELPCDVATILAGNGNSNSGGSK